MFKRFFLIVTFLCTAVSCGENRTVEQPENEQQDLSNDGFPALTDCLYEDDTAGEDNVVTDEDSAIDGEADDNDTSTDQDIETEDENAIPDEDSFPDEDLVEDEESTVDGIVEDKSVFLEGNNNCYMVQAYFPKESLLEFLPEDLALPEDADMKKYYPDTVLKDGKHPFLASFCHGSEIHDILTDQSVPEQEELMFLFPVIYTHSDGIKYMCSYSPVLYLDSRLGVTGGLYYGLRKEYHPEMEYGEPDDHSKWWSIEDILDVSFKQVGEDLNKPPQFFRQILSSPFVTMSYPQPLVTMVFYQSKVYEEKVRNVEGSLWWNYNDSDIYDDVDSVFIYSKYFFTMSKPMNRNKFYDN